MRFSTLLCDTVNLPYYFNKKLFSIVVHFTLPIPICFKLKLTDRKQCNQIIVRLLFTAFTRAHMYTDSHTQTHTHIYSTTHSHTLYISILNVAPNKTWKIMFCQC